MTDDQAHALELIEQRKKAKVSLFWLETLHLALTALTCWASIFIAFQWMGSFGTAVSFGLGGLVLIGLVIGRFLQIPLGDLYRQFTYREGFFLMLVHFAVLIMPRMLFGIRDMATLTCILMIFVSLQSINAIWYARLYAVTGALVLLTILLGEPLPPVWALALYMYLVLITFRLDYLRFRVEKYGEERGVELKSSVLRSFWKTAIPVLIGLGVYMAMTPYLVRRKLKLDPGMIERDGTDVFMSYSEVIWNAIFMTGAIIVLVLLLNLLDKKLRKRQVQPEIDEEGPVTNVREFERQAQEESRLVLDEPSGPPQKILNAFKEFEHRMTTFGLNRQEEETVEQYFKRVTKTMELSFEDEERIPDPFNLAVYNMNEPSSEDAEYFETELTKFTNQAVSRLEDTASLEGGEDPDLPEKNE